MAIKPFSRLIKILTGVYSGAESELSRLERFAHLCALVIRSFVRNRCPVRAAALSYTTLLALIPLLAVAISVTSSLLKNEGEEKIYQAIDKLVSTVMPPAGSNTNAIFVPLKPGPGMPVVPPPTNTETAGVPTNSVAETNRVAAATGAEDRVANAQKEAAEYIDKFIQKTRSSTLGVAGTVLLIFVVFSLLGRIEETMNDVLGRHPQPELADPHRTLLVCHRPGANIADCRPDSRLGPTVRRRAALRRIHATGK